VRVCRGAACQRSTLQTGLTGETNMNTATIDAMAAPDVHAETADVRITRIETIIPTLATKADLEGLRADFEKGQKENRAWMLGTVLALFVGIVGTGSYFMSGIQQPIMQPAAQQAPIIIYATPPPAPSGN